jgi:UDP-N-acetylglucosamine 2-epimerase (non-hydrolysing)
MKEVLSAYAAQINDSEILENLKLEPGGYFVFSAHREENVDRPERLRILLDTLSLIAKIYGKPVIVSTHPRTKKRLDALGDLRQDARIRFSPAFGLFEYVKLEKNALCVISDSGTLTEESSILHFPAVMIREAHERPEGMDEGVLIMCGLNQEAILESIKVTLAQLAEDPKPPRIVADYDVDNVSRKVVRIIMSYTDYVNRTVWFK